MAEGGLFSIAGAIINTLAPLVREEIGLLWGFRNELENLKRTVSSIQAVLLDAEERRAKNNAVNHWLGELSDILYEVDDFVDAMSTEALRQGKITGDNKAKKVCKLPSILKHPFHVLKMGRRLREIRGKIDAIAADISKFQFLERSEEGHRDLRRGDTYSDLGVESVIGRDSDKKAVTDRLMASNVEGNVSIVPIVGIGGLGKTTLAKLIFNDPEIQGTFELKMWICVSEPFDVKVIVKKILKSVKEEFHDSDPMDELVKHLRVGIEGKKYLLVLDDVWCEVSSQLFELNNLLMYGGRGSKILVTTRKLSVANILRTKPHQLDGLGEDDSWELFKRVAFVNGSELGNFEKMGREILKKCKGVPLAVKTVRRLLYSKGINEWQIFIKDELSKIPQEQAEIIPTLKLSYDELPSYLKHCFAFCSLFPKDYMFDTSTLINLWIANGYVESKGNQCWEEIGRKYFMDLLWRSFFQEAKMNDFGDVIECKMHDLMHDLAELVARPLITTFPLKDRSSFKEIRHIAVAYNMSSCSDMLGSLYNISRIRTFLCPTAAYESYQEVEIDCEAIIKSFKFLRVLDLSKRNLKHVPSSIGKLKHLRYFSLSHNEEIKELPRSITKIVNLQCLCLLNCKQLVGFPKGFKKLVNLRHLDLDGCRSLRCMPDGMGQLTNLHMLNVFSCKSLKELPGDIIKLVNLRFLYMNSVTGLEYLPRGFGKLTNLQELPYFVANSGSTSRDSGGLDELKGLNNLRGPLKIKVLSCGKDVGKAYKLAKLKDKQNFDSLMVNCWDAAVNDFDDNILLESLQLHLKLEHLDLRCDRCSRHPTWMSSVTKLVSLSLTKCTKWQYLPPLGHLPFLEDLDLEDMDGLEYVSNCDEWSASSSSSLTLLLLFPSLKKIYVSLCPNLKGWWKNSPTKVESLLVSFPLLSSVYISHCPMLTSMPIFWHLKESLTWRGTNWKTLQQTQLMNTSATTTFSVLPFAPLSKLKELKLTSIPDLENLPEEGLQNLTSLKILKFNYCEKLKSLSPGVQHLTKVQTLEIWACQMFGDNEDGMQWEGLKSLSHLLFQSLPNLSSLPSGLQHVSTLKSLTTGGCDSLTSVPDWIHNCRSLEELYIDECYNLASLPVGTCEQWSLQRLRISGSPILLQKCEKENGEYWPKIAHIPHLNIFEDQKVLT